MPKQKLPDQLYAQGPGLPGGKVVGTDDNQPALQGFFVEQHQMEKGLLSERHAINFFWYDPASNTFTTSGFMDYGPTYSAVITMSEHTWTWKGTHVYAGMKTPFRITQIFAADWMRRVSARPCISQRRKGGAPSSINGLKRPEVSLETL